MHCPICTFTQARTYACWSAFKVLQCRSCGFRFVDTAAPEYPRNAQYAFDEPEVGTIRPGLPHIQRRVRDILRFKQPPGRALDIGCGKGEVALALNEKGFACAGIDMKPRIISYLRTHSPQVRWRCAEVSELAALSERFDVLTMYHVLEHIPNPTAALVTVKALANPGALIVIEVPHVGGWGARLTGTRWHYYKVDHVNYFRAADLRRLAAAVDLTVRGVRGYQHFSYPQDVLWKDAIKGTLGWLGFKDVISFFLEQP